LTMANFKKNGDYEIIFPNNWNLFSIFRI
jgi:hypothetical protein